MLGSFTLVRDGTTVPLAVDARRVVAYLAVHPRPQPRAALAADLWPGTPSDAASRLLDEAVEAIGVPGLLADELDGQLALGSDVQVDLAEAMALVRALPEHPAPGPSEVGLLRADILPSWTSSWIAVERERFRQLRLYALEELSLRLIAAARHDDAIRIAQIAVAAAPSRESARRALIEAHLAQGNIAAAVAEYDEYRELLRSSVGGPVATALDTVLPPSPAWPAVRGFRRPVQRSAVALPGLRSIRNAPTAARRLVTGGSITGPGR
ncbi:AfsR/SARP family transcriptional regulator [Pseudonocardia bannensis]|uniref:SARP family transcriptional regulator n=1 Tax=Pseudonocardia bannensis TaxID=630973 RepID=A0A848DE02_9PSEU|nr:BTAD domain-containing putative transcriptional regulator [Pseudonocardia bannensis]NMH90850.1 SARP family transcriptional regulator [Pseudonocardia bannensis]